MTYDEKKAEEWSLMEKFIASYDDWPKGKLVKTESPDFILHLGRKKSVGIELTSLAGPPDMETIGQCIRKKEEKLGLYRKKRLNRYLLVIVAEHALDEAGFNLPNKLEQWSFSSSFQEVFLFDPSAGKIFHLN